MGSQLLQVLFQGVIASITGGFYHDPREHIFSNTLHLYLWLLLLALPLILNIYFTSSFVIWSLYCGSIGGLFTIVKLVNYRFHRLFDNAEPILKEPTSPDEIDGEEEDINSKNKSRPKSKQDEEEENGIELQIIPSSSSTNNENERDRLSQENQPSVIESRFKVEVHRRDCSSSSIDSEVPVPSKPKRSHQTKSSKENLDSNSNENAVDENVEVINIEMNESLVPSLSSPISKEFSCISIDTNYQNEAREGFSNVVMSLESGLATSSSKTKENDGANLMKETKSLELGQALNQEESLKKNKRQNFRRTQSAFIKGTNPNINNNNLLRASDRSTSNNLIQDTFKNSSIKSHSLDDGVMENTNKSSTNVSSIVSVDENLNSEQQKQKEHEIEESDSESDDQRRSRTPLLARHSSLEQKSKIKKETSFSGSSSSNKKVSFNTRPFQDGEKHSNLSMSCPLNVANPIQNQSEWVVNNDEEGNILENIPIISSQSSDSTLIPANASESTSNTNTNVQREKRKKEKSHRHHHNQKKFALVPQDNSVVGGNLAGGPLVTDWLFQAVNVGIKAIAGPSSDITAVGENTNINVAAEVSSIRSDDSNSLTGVNVLFGSNTDINNIGKNKPESVVIELDGSNSENSSKLLPTNYEDINVPKKNRRVGQRQLSHEEKKSRHRNSRTPAEQEPLPSSNWRNERESSPRILERLLEESHYENPIFGIPTTSHPLEIVNNSTRRHRREREISDGATANTTNAFLQTAARELRQTFRYLGQQNNSLDIQTSTPSTSNTNTTTNARANIIQGGVFRPNRDELVCDIDNATSTLNRHRRLRRLAHSRRSLQREREREIASPLSTILPTALTMGPVFPVTGGSAVNSPHIAASHDDTTDGSVHYFQDERGNWHSYTFGTGVTNSLSTALPPLAPTFEQSPRRRRRSRGSGTSGDGISRSSAIRTATIGIGSEINSIRDIIKTPSSSESWTESESETELAIDSITNRMYPSYRSRNNNLGSSRNQSQSGISGLPSPNLSVPSLVTITPEYSSSSITNRLPLPSYAMQHAAARTRNRTRRDVLQALTESILERRRNHPYNADIGQDIVDGNVSDSAKKKLPKFYYKMQLIPFLKCEFNIWFDRLKLMNVFDWNESLIENFIAILFGVGVAIIGSYLLHRGYYKDLTVVLLCFVMAGCQFSLLKSVQPDASSPTHGFNRLVAFSRSIYFCICGGIVIFLQTLIDNQSYGLGVEIYKFDLLNKPLIHLLKESILIFILFFPLLFSIGIFPMFNSFTHYLLEQIDIHLFGGNATISLFTAFIDLSKSILAVCLLYGFSYGSLENQSSQHLLFSILCGLFVAVSYHMSRCASDHSVLWVVLKSHLCPDESLDCFGELPSNVKSREAESSGDPLPKKLRDTVNARLTSDAIICIVISVITFGLHASTVFSALQPGLKPVLLFLAIFLGFLLHYILPQFRKQLPLQLVSHPILKTNEYNQFEVRDEAVLMWFEKIYVWLSFFEKNIVYPLLFIAALTEDSPLIVSEERFGLGLGALIVVIVGLKAFRKFFSDPGRSYLVLLFTFLFFNFDFHGYSETFIVDYFFMCIIFDKVYELWLKLQFVITYIAPHQITWGSAFHAFAQPFNIPHSAMLFLQIIISSIFSAPLNPFLGSAIFITSYVRPVKFWERDYNTKRVDHSNTRLSTHIEKNPGADDNNLNSIFYEHLTRSLQDSFCGDLLLGRWGLVSQGDCFVLASDYLNALVHIIEIGNGLVTFQIRGLEFRGTYCQQREVESINENQDDDDSCCCCETGKIPHMLSINAAFSQRWLSWEVTMTKYVLEGYSISDNSAVSMLQVFELRKILITYYVKSLIYFAIREDKLNEWLENEEITTALRPTLESGYADLDPVFSVKIDEDYDFSVSGITRNSYCNAYLSWIQYCLMKRDANKQGPTVAIESGRDSILVSLCFGLSILARRALGVAAHSNTSVEFFLYGLHALFKGDFRITSQRDEWVFSDMDLLKKVVSPAVRMSLKLHQDHFMSPDEYDDHSALFEAISYHIDNLVISHEGDPGWRSAVLAGTPALLALRHVLDDGADEYKIIMLNKRHLSFRVIKLNRECVRGLWSGQQQELIYFRNRDPERGSIQNAKQALRNIINSSCDQPIGYPIYVSPLTTSYADTHKQYCSLVGGPVSLNKIKKSAISLWRRIRRRCGEGCSSGSHTLPEETHSPYGHDGVYTTSSVILPSGVNISGSQSLEGGSSIGRSSLSNRGSNFNRGGSIASNVSVSNKPSTSIASLTGFLTDANGKEREKEKSSSLQRVRIVDADQVYDGLNLGRRIDPIWPDVEMKARGGRNFWIGWVADDNMEGVVVHKWIPNHPDKKFRSISDKTILLVKIEDKFVPINEQGVVYLSPLNSGPFPLPLPNDT